MAIKRYTMNPGKWNLKPIIWNWPTFVTAWPSLANKSCLFPQQAWCFFSIRDLPDWKSKGFAFFQFWILFSSPKLVDPAGTDIKWKHKYTPGLAWTFKSGSKYKNTTQWCEENTADVKLRHSAGSGWRKTFNFIMFCPPQKKNPGRRAPPVRKRRDGAFVIDCLTWCCRRVYFQHVPPKWQIVAVGPLLWTLGPFLVLFMCFYMFILLTPRLSSVRLIRFFPIGVFVFIHLLFCVTLCCCYLMLFFGRCLRLSVGWFFCCFFFHYVTSIFVQK